MSVKCRVLKKEKRIRFPTYFNIFLIQIHLHFKLNFALGSLSTFTFIFGHLRSHIAHSFLYKCRTVLPNVIQICHSKFSFRISLNQFCHLPTNVTTFAFKFVVYWHGRCYMTYQFSPDLYIIIMLTTYVIAGQSYFTKSKEQFLEFFAQLWNSYHKALRPAGTNLHAKWWNSINKCLKNWSEMNIFDQRLNWSRWSDISSFPHTQIFLVEIEVDHQWI